MGVIAHNVQYEEELIMSSNITTSFVEQYSSNVTLLSQANGQ